MKVDHAKSLRAALAKHDDDVNRIAEFMVRFAKRFPMHEPTQWERELRLAAVDLLEAVKVDLPAVLDELDRLRSGEMTDIEATRAMR